MRCHQSLAISARNATNLPTLPQAQYYPSQNIIAKARALTCQARGSNSLSPIFPSFSRWPFMGALRLTTLSLSQLGKLNQRKVWLTHHWRHCSLAGNLAKWFAPVFTTGLLDYGPIPASVTNAALRSPSLPTCFVWVVTQTAHRLPASLQGSCM